MRQQPSPQFILENSSREDKHECPFARSSIQLTLILCEILHIGEPCMCALPVPLPALLPPS